MKSNNIYFSSIKESRDWYFVEYTPPLPNYRFSNLSLSIVDQSKSPSEVAEAVESESRHWLCLYRIPLMATAFTLEGDVLSLAGIKPINHLIAWQDANSEHVTLKWELVPDVDLPEIALNRDFLKHIFSDVPFRTDEDIQNAAYKRFSNLRNGWRLVFIWAVIIPITVSLLEWWSDLLGLAVVVYAFIKATIKALRLMGHLPKSEWEKEREIKEGKMSHYYYHCERNPEAFQLLKLENFRNEEIEKTKLEAEHLKNLK